MPITSMHHDRRLSRTALHLLLHIRTVLDILPEIADVATNFLVRLERERDNRDEAERKPFPRFVSRCDIRIVEGKGYEDVPSLHHSTGEVAAVLALHCNVFCAAELRLEGWRALVVRSIA